MTCLRCQHTTVKRFGYYGRSKVQRFRCKACHATFSEPQVKPLGPHTTDLGKATEIISLMVEGMSVRAISRITGADKNTILSLLLTVGDKFRRIFDSRIRDVRPHYVQLDETWSFVHTKEKHLSEGDPGEWGDAYTWLALDAQSKLIISYLVGKRDGLSALEFIGDFSHRVRGRLQVTSDGFKPYIGAMEEYFGADVDFAQLVKVYGTPDNAGPDWYGPPQVIAAVPTPVTGKPDFAHICTSHVERANLTVRMQLRRFTRLTNGFSKKLSHLKAAVSIFATWYNFVRIHQTIRVTPAMEAGITSHVWELEELLLA